MKIISKYKDYYDYCEYLGIDPKCIYKRDTKVISLNKSHRKIWPVEESLYLDYWRIYEEGGRWPVEEMWVGWLAFCGILYPHFLIRVKEDVFITRDLNQAQIFLSRTTHRRWWKDKATRFNERVKELQEKKVPDSFFIKHNSPAILYDPKNSKLTLNPNLQDLQFYHVKTAEQAWQELSMFLMSVLKVDQRPMVEVEDKYRIHAHGFDKSSFRREQHPHKPRSKK